MRWHLLAFLSMFLSGRLCCGFRPVLHQRSGAASAVHPLSRRLLGSAIGAEPPIILPKESFRRTVTIASLSVPTAETHAAVRALSRDLLDRPRVRTVEKPAGRPGTRVLLLGEHVAPGSGLVGLSAASRAALRAGWEAGVHRLELGWEHVSVAEALRALLPAGVEPLSAFESAGHVAHVNLRPEHAAHKRLVGAVILDKNPRLRTVVNKVGGITSAFRTFAMEVIAGDAGDLDVELVESNCTFAFTYGEAYWNSRLQEEHRRILALLRPGDVVCDLFAGVGPFAVPAARHRKASVLANDLNPRAVAALRWAARRNGVGLEEVDDRTGERVSDCGGDNGDDRNGDCGGDHGGAVDAAGTANGLAGTPAPGTVRSFCLDAGAFVARVAAGGLTRPTHVLMNLPALAVDFLPALDPFRARGARGAPARADGTAAAEQEVDYQAVRVHCYCFAFGDDAPAAAVGAVEAGLNVAAGSLEANGRLAYVHTVRSVAPTKTMVCVGFDLPPLAAGVG